MVKIAAAKLPLACRIIFEQMPPTAYLKRNPVARRRPDL